MARWVGTQGQVNSATKMKTCPHYDITQRKPQTQNEKNYFSVKKIIFSEGLSCSLAQSAGE